MCAGGKVTEFVHNHWEYGIDRTNAGWTAYAVSQFDTRPTISTGAHPTRQAAVVDITSMIDSENQRITERHFDKKKQEQ
jgi:hypothetical protein